MSRELDERVARVLGYEPVIDSESGSVLINGYPFPDSTHPDSFIVAHWLLAEVERRGLDAQYVAALCNSVQVPHGPVQMHADYVWRLLNAIPEQHCRAFLAVTEPVA